MEINIEPNNPPPPDGVPPLNLGDKCHKKNNMNEWEKNFEKESALLKSERETYKNYDVALKLFDRLSFMFKISGFIALVLIFFTDITLVQATCLFIIGYTIAPTDGDLREAPFKGMIEDLAHIRVNTTIIGKHVKNEKIPNNIQAKSLTAIEFKGLKSCFLAI